MPAAHFLLSLSLLSSPAIAFSPLVRRPPGKSWTPARETGRPSDANRLGWSPNPTDVPGPPPRYGGMDLLRRADDFSRGSDTCGFVSATTPSPVTCVQEGSYCTDDGAGNMDCCTGEYSQCTSTMYSVCLDYSASQKGACDNAGPRTICCWEESPACNTLLMEATVGKFLSIYQCQAVKNIVTLYPSPPSPSSASSSSSSSSDTRPATTISSTMIITNGNGGQIPPPGGSGNNNSGGNSIPIGAIVGGAVGGVAAIGLIAFLFFFFIIRNKRKDDVVRDAKPPDTTQNPPQQPAIVSAPSPQSTYQPPGGFQQVAPQQAQYPGSMGEVKDFDQPQPQLQHQQQQSYGYYAAAGTSLPSSTSPGAQLNQGFDLPQHPPPPQQQYPQGPYSLPQAQSQPMVVVNELPAISANHRAELN